MIAGIFKNFGRGLLYVLLFPLIIIAVSLYGVVGIFVFIIQFIKMIILFFGGRTLTSDFPEDIAAKAILGELSLEKEEENKEDKPLSLYPSDSPVYGSGYSSPLFQDKPSQSEEDDEPLLEEEENDD